MNGITDILTELLDDGRSNANVQNYVAEIIKNIKDTDDFKAAMKYYIENNCVVEGSAIKCSTNSSAASGTAPAEYDLEAPGNH